MTADIHVWDYTMLSNTQRRWERLRVVESVTFPYQQKPCSGHHVLSHESTELPPESRHSLSSILRFLLKLCPQCLRRSDRHTITHSAFPSPVFLKMASCSVVSRTSHRDSLFLALYPISIYICVSPFPFSINLLPFPNDALRRNSSARWPRSVTASSRSERFLRRGRLHERRTSRNAVVGGQELGPLYNHSQSVRSLQGARSHLGELAGHRWGNFSRCFAFLLNSSRRQRVRGPSWCKEQSGRRKPLLYYAWPKR